MSNLKQIVFELKCPLCLNHFVKSDFFKKVSDLPILGHVNNGNHTSLICPVNLKI